MAQKRNQHVVPRGDNWAVVGEGNPRATAITRTQQEAIQIAKPIAQSNRSEVVIHRPNGQIRDRDSYGHDPNPPRDTKH